MTAPDTREFVTFPRGHVRDKILLAHFRNQLRAYVNPDTGAVFTEDEIARATQPGTRFYAEADAIDILGQATQARAAFFADQVDPSRANTRMLEDFHANLWLGPDARLPAVGATGTVRWVATVGTIFPGSYTLDDPSAFVATDANGNRYQCLVTVVAGASGYADLSVQGIDGGFVTNLDPDTSLRGSLNTPLGAQPQGTVQAQVGDASAGLSGGFDVETDKELADRVEERVRFRPASGNGAHFVAWARQASVAVQTAFVYSCALHAGSVLVCVLEKRDTSADNGPEARIASAGTLTAATAYLVPPASPVVPERAYVVVTTAVPEATDLVCRLSMSQGTGGGWFDVEPWPAPTEPAVASQISQAQISALVSQLSFTISVEDSPLPGNVTSLTAPNAPAFMAWDEATSRFEQLDVLSVTDNLNDTFAVVLSTAPTITLAVGSRISPYTDRAETIALALEAYFDALGPGEMIEATDVRFARNARYPRPSQKWPARVGQALGSALSDALGGVAADAELTYSSATLPTLPADPLDGPSILTLGAVNLYAF